MKAAQFARYSSKMQDGDLSSSAQFGEMDLFCQREGLTAVRRFEAPETSSFVLNESPVFQEMLAAARRREFSVLVVHKLDRLGRDVATTVQARAVLMRAGVTVRSVVENLGDNIQGELITNVLGAINQYFSQNLGSETVKGHRELTRRGLWKGGAAPYGYRAVKVASGCRQHTALEPDPVQSHVVKTVFERVAAGHRTREIMNWVEETTGQRWSSPTLYARIKNPLYRGQIQYGRTSLKRHKRILNDESQVVTGTVEALVTPEIWEEANRQVAERAAKRTQGRAPKRAYMLSEGVSTCSTCGRPLVGNVTFGVPKYTCSGRRDHECPVRVGANAEELEAAVHQVFTKEMARFDLEGFMENYESSLVPELEAAKRREAGLRKELTEVRKQLKNLASALAQGCDFSAVRELMEGLQREEKTFADEIALCQLAAEKNIKTNVTLVRSYLTSFADLVPDMTAEELKEFYRRNVRVEWDLEKQRGQLYLKLTPADRREVSLHGNTMVGVHGSSLVR